MRMPRTWRADIHFGQTVHDAAVLDALFAVTLLAQRGELHFQLLQFVDAGVDVRNVLVDQRIDAAAAISLFLWFCCDARCAVATIISCSKCGLHGPYPDAPYQISHKRRAPSINVASSFEKLRRINPESVPSL